VPETATGHPADEEEGTAVRQDFFRRLMANRLSAFGVVLLTAIVLIVLAGPLLWRTSPNAQDLLFRSAPPSAAHPLGTDNLGRDVLSRVLHGGRVSLAISFGSTFLSVVTGLALGLAAGFTGGIVDTIIMRIGDVMLSIPFLLLALMIAITLGPGIINTVIALTIPAIPREARIVRSVVISVKERDHVFAARACGVRTSRIMTRHVLANSMSVVLVMAAASVSFTLLGAAGLGFLGLGVQPPGAEWGAMLTDGRTYIINRPLVVIVPGLAIFLSALSANLVGDALRDTLDPNR
jgi:peptide/nickel transport system permease protein